MHMARFPFSSLRVGTRGAPSAARGASVVKATASGRGIFAARAEGARNGKQTAGIEGNEQRRLSRSGNRSAAGRRHPCTTDLNWPCSGDVTSRSGWPSCAPRVAAAPRAPRPHRPGRQAEGRHRIKAGTALSRFGAVPHEGGAGRSRGRAQPGCAAARPPRNPAEVLTAGVAEESAADAKAEAVEDVAEADPEDVQSFGGSRVGPDVAVRRSGGCSGVGNSRRGQDGSGKSEGDKYALGVVHARANDLGPFLVTIRSEAWANRSSHLLIPWERTRVQATYPGTYVCKSVQGRGRSQTSHSHHTASVGQRV